MSDREAEVEAVYKPEAGKPWDVRIVHLQSYVHFADADCNGKNTFRVSSYYDLIRVCPADLPDPADWNNNSRSVLKQGYDKMQELLGESSDRLYQSQHMILAFRKNEGSEDTAKIKAFWNKESDLFFATMVNVGINQKLDEVISRINRIFRDEDYLIYHTLEYNELLIFCRGKTFRQHSELVMRLNYECRKEDETGSVTDSSNVIDTITICGFRSGITDSDEEETLDLLFQFGIRDYEKAKSLLEETIGADKVRWVLGRNDVAVYLPNSHLSTLRQIYRKYRDADKEGANRFLITAEVSLANTAAADSLFTKNCWEGGERKVAKRVEEMLSSRLEELKDYTERLDKLVGTELTKVFLRMLNDLRMQIVNIQRNQLADDLAVCLLPQFLSFLDYLLYVSKAEEVSKDISREHFKTCLNEFYLNMASLINSTVHSSRQFVQVPHCGATAFEMPPKVMACYVITAKKIIDALRDVQKAKYGVMLSPKMVDELDVESYHILHHADPNQMLSISISEHMLYNPIRTVSILGHEAAHFVGERARERGVRRNRLLSYYIFKLIRELVEKYRYRMPRDYSRAERYEDQEVLAGRILALSDRLADDLFPASEKKDEELFKRNLLSQIESLPHRLLDNVQYRDIIFSEIFFPPDERSEPLCALALKSCAPNGSDRKMLRICAKRLYSETIGAYRHKVMRNEYHVELSKDFERGVGYVFSEAYADVIMILLFDMDQETYASVFLQALNWSFQVGAISDEIMLIRYCAVLLALHTTKIWDIPTETSVSPEEIADWDTAIRQATGYLFSDIFWKNRDKPLAMKVASYLESCIKSFQEQLKSNEDRVAQVREIYNTLAGEDPCEFLELVRKLERDLYQEYENPAFPDQSTEG